MDTNFTEKRVQPRAAKRFATFVHRLVEEHAPLLRVEVTDVAEAGVGLMSMIPLAPSDRVAVDLAAVNAAQRELLLCQVRHCTKSPSGQFRIGVNVIDRRPGTSVGTRIPKEWLAKA